MGGGRKRKRRFVQTLLHLFLHISPEIHGTIWIICGLLQNFLWHYSRYIFIVLQKPPPHAPAYCCCGIFVLCVILLRWEYVAPSSWYINSQHNIITPSIHSQLAFCQLILTDCRASSFFILTFKQKYVSTILQPQVPSRIIVNSKLPFLVLDVGRLICILQFRTQLSEIARSEYGITSNTTRDL